MKKKFDLEKIKKYTLIPFKDCGRSFDGCDCGGLVWLVYKNELGIELPKWNDLYDSTQYSNADLIESVAVSMLGDNGVEVAREDIQPFDVVSLRIGSANMHVGIVVDKNSFLHIIEGKSNVSCERLDGIRWRNKINGVFRHAEMC